jgi:AcrR family transcriptional regulator
MSTRQRLIQAALDLFSHQGISGTTTRQIANLAEVNEVTLFRQFGNKYGLLLAVMEEAAVFQNLSAALVPLEQFSDLPPASLAEIMKSYASLCLQKFAQAPDLVRSIVGEADQYPEENRRSLGIGLTQINQAVAQYFAYSFDQYLSQTQQRDTIALTLAPEKLASVLHSALLGYTTLELTSEFHQLWRDRQDFLDSLVQLMVQGAIAPPTATIANTLSAPVPPVTIPERATIVDLPGPVVHLILQRARKLGLRDYGLCYVLFGAGVSALEAINLERSHAISDPTQHLLKVVTGSDATSEAVSDHGPDSRPRPQVRLMPVNQWILGKRYGSYTNNPLTKWLRSRKDSQSALFLDAEGQPLSLADLHACWALWTEGLPPATGPLLEVAQAQHTWFVEMLMRGLSVDNLGILTGRDRAQLQPYAQRAAEKIALEQALRLDQKSRSAPGGVTPGAEVEKLDPRSNPKA